LKVLIVPEDPDQLQMDLTIKREELQLLKQQHALRFQHLQLGDRSTV
jgi:hypothetical protein